MLHLKTLGNGVGHGTVGNQIQQVGLGLLGRVPLGFEIALGHGADRATGGVLEQHHRVVVAGRNGGIQVFKALQWLPHHI